MCTVVCSWGATRERSRVGLCARRGVRGDRGWEFAVRCVDYPFVLDDALRTELTLWGMTGHILSIAQAACTVLAVTGTMAAYFCECALPFSFQNLFGARSIAAVHRRVVFGSGRALCMFHAWVSQFLRDRCGYF